MPPTGSGGAGAAAVLPGPFTFFQYVAGGSSQLVISNNTVQAWGMWIGYSITFANMGVNVNTADAVNSYDLGLYSSAGTLVAHIGAQTLPSTGAQHFTIVGGSKTLPAGQYFFAATGVSAVAFLTQAPGLFLYSYTASTGVSSGSVLPASISPPALNFQGGGMPAFVLY